MIFIETNTFNHLQSAVPFVQRHTEASSIILEQSKGNQKKADVTMKSRVFCDGRRSSWKERLDLDCEGPVCFDKKFRSNEWF